MPYSYSNTDTYMIAIPIYLVVQETGQSNKNSPQYVTLEVKLTRVAADVAALRYENATVIKMLADKVIPTD